MKGGTHKFGFRVYWLAEQGLTFKNVFLAIISLIVFLFTEIILTFWFKKKENENMRNKNIKITNCFLNAIYVLCGNIAGGTLLANTL